MASEWVAVVGTAIGAGIGGVVTVVSLAVKGTQDRDARADEAALEESRRIDDRAWQIKVQNIDERRALYARLLRSASELVDGLLPLTWSPPDDSFEEDTRERMKESEDNANQLYNAFRQNAADTDVASVNRAVVQLVEMFSSSANNILASVFLLGPDDEHQPTHRQLKDDLLPALRDACRRDLGYDTPQQEGQI